MGHALAPRLWLRSDVRHQVFLSEMVPDGQHLPYLSPAEVARLPGSRLSGLRLTRHSDRAGQEAQADLRAVRVERSAAAGAFASDCVERNDGPYSQVRGTGVRGALCLRRSPHDRGSDAPRRGAVRRFIARDLSSSSALLYRGEGKGPRGSNDPGGKDSMNAQDRSSAVGAAMVVGGGIGGDRKSTRLNSSHVRISYA